ncbi:hypothetical protein ABB27_13965 [Stenotrophomonas terrae]|uniref:Uncharacterized protein n=1 Tax=Stenotrophomonas terrae TaxID=405446 RepID=A0A0R0CKL4_9GAMM|nr:hypothetical protein ABB27_13965 [Stenotrophomonas terrae]
MIDELDLLQDKLHLLGFSAQIFEPPLKKLENSLSPQLLTKQSANIKQYLTEDVYTGLAFCSELLPVEEEGILQEDFADLVGLINQLELLLIDNAFPAPLTALIRRHIRLAELAIAQYPIRGAGALKEAVKYATGDIYFSESDLTDISFEGGQSLKSLWQRMNSLADKAIKADNLFQIGSRATKLLDDLINS